MRKGKRFRVLCGFTARRLCFSHAAGKSVRQPQNSRLKWGTKDAGSSSRDGTDSWITIAADGMRSVSDVLPDSDSDPCHCEISTEDFLPRFFFSPSWAVVESSVTESGKDIPLPMSQQLHAGGKPNRIAAPDAIRPSASPDHPSALNTSWTALTTAISPCHLRHNIRNIWLSCILTCSSVHVRGLN